MTARRLVSAAIVAGLTHVPAARADEPYFTARTGGSPVPTVAGEWERSGSSASLVLRGATIRHAKTTIDAGITFAAVGRKNGRCPWFTQSFTATSFVDPAATFDVVTDVRYRRPGGRWSRWMSFDDMGVPRGLRQDNAPSAGLVVRPSPTCRGAWEYGWRVRATVEGDALLAPVMFDLDVVSS